MRSSGAEPEFELRKAEARATLPKGLKIALDHPTNSQAHSRGEDHADAREGLITQFNLTQLQPQAILDMQLQRLTGLERQKILDQLPRLVKTIERLRVIPSSEDLLMQVALGELKAVRELLGDECWNRERTMESGEFRIRGLDRR